MQDEKILIELARLILPLGFVENFKITSIVSNKNDVEMSLDEFENIPEERKGHRLESKGFLDAVT
ncbi:MAG: DDE transposase, partial [Bacteroidaceae bacterium]|nr:DDE transposase [Bacteroidaceae bacterium]